ncbi:MAG: DegT/DnrJ/EryC1/StrS family aminotransferase [Gammaproteobacteria bacterium]|nr:DegT/DnrJ/EryC1/StrS family aminotransferase [Gammaproteobacteria bacterium]
MWVRRRLDIQWSDLAFGLWRCFSTDENRRAAIERAWSGDASALACLSVRTGFDLCWQALEVPKGSEVLMSAINVPAMFRLVEEYGLIPVPLDIDAASLRPTVEDVRQAITPRTRAIVVAHLFGTRVDLGDIAALARERGLVLIEDHAQAFSGVPDAASSSADVALWSFGPIKAATALGGAIAVALDPQLMGRMRAIESTYPVQRRIRYASRLLKYATLKAVSYRLPFGVLMGVLSWAGVDTDAWLNARVRSFDDTAPLSALRRRPSGPLLALLDRRLRTFDAAGVACRRRRGLALERMVEDHARVPGAAAAWRGFDLFPVCVADTARLVAALRRYGFDAGTGRNLAVFGEEEGAGLVGACRLLANAVFIPFYAAMPDRELRRLARALKDGLRKRTAVL